MSVACASKVRFMRVIYHWYNQDFAILRNQRLGEDVAKAFSEKACRWMLLSKGPSEQPHIQQLLDKDYHVVATGKDNTLILYQKNEPNK